MTGDERKPAKTGNWTVQIRPSEPTGPRFWVSGHFRYKTDFDDFLRTLAILRSLADEERAPVAHVVPGGQDALSALTAA